MKNILITSIISATCAFSVASGAADGTINFVGSISSATCNVSANSKDMTVTLGTVSSSAFENKAGAHAAPTSFTLTVSGCDNAISSANVKFDAIPDSINKSLYSLGTGTGIASGVAIAIADTSTAYVAPNTASTAYPLKPSVNNDLNFVAYYVSTASSVTQGSANLSVPFTIVYN